MPNINAFRQVVHEKMIFKVFCYINLYKLSPKGASICDLRDFI